MKNLTLNSFVFLLFVLLFTSCKVESIKPVPNTKAITANPSLSIDAQAKTVSGIAH